MPKFIKEYFNYTVSEKRGIFVLLIVIAAIYAAPTLMEYFSTEQQVDFSEFEKRISQVEKGLPKESLKTNIEKANLTYFDPNTVPLNQLLQMGFNSKQANNILNYRNAGGVFKTKDDLKKIYTINDSLFNKLKPYIKIVRTTDVSEPNKTQVDTTNYIKTFPNLEENPNNYKLIELNTADSTDLIRLKGIGPTMARRIINYRNFLGGFYQSQQLLEVYGINQTLFESIHSNIKIDSTYIRKININQIDFKTINKHPYISYANTKTIVKYRSLMGGFKSVNEIISNNLVDTLTYNKIKPYLSVY